MAGRSPSESEVLMKGRHGASGAWLACAAITLLLAGGAVPGDALGMPQDPGAPPSPPLTKKALEKQIKRADQDARDAARRARHFQRIADEARRRGDAQKADFNQKLADGFLRDRESAFARAAEARSMLVDLQAGRTPKPASPASESPATPMAEDPALPGVDSPVPPVPPAPGVPGEGFPAVPETGAKPAPGLPGEKPAAPQDPAPPPSAATPRRFTGYLEALEDPDNHPHTLCARILLLPVVGQLLARRMQLTLGDNPPAGCPLDCEGEDDDLCTGECYDVPLIDGRPLKLRLAVSKLFVENPEPGVPLLSKIPVLGRLFFSSSPTFRDERSLILIIRPTVIEP